MVALKVRDGSGVDEIGKIAEATLWRVWDAKLRNLDLILKEMKSQICLNSLVSPTPHSFPGLAQWKASAATGTYLLIHRLSQPPGGEHWVLA